METINKLKMYILPILLIIIGLVVANSKDELIVPSTNQVVEVSNKGLGSVMVILGVAILIYKIWKKE